MLDSELVEKGRRSFEWAKAHMPALTLAEHYVESRISSKMAGKNPFRGLKLAACLHVSKETSVLIRSLNSLGLDIYLVAANPLSSQNDIAAFLSSEGILVRARRGESSEDYQNEIRTAAKSSPDLMIDDGGELHVAYARTRSQSCVGGTDETTSGTFRLKALDLAGKLRYPAIPVNEARTKHIFDNRYGTGQSAIDGLIRATGLLVAGKIIVVAGYGWVGRGVSERARGLGARVIVTEVDPARALEATLDGFEVIPMNEAARIGDIFLTCTGQINAINSTHLRILKDGAILGNVGHFDQEIDVRSLFGIAERSEEVRENVVKIERRTSLLSREKNKLQSIYLLCQGRVINLASAEGHPPEVMQLSFANQLLSLFYLVTNQKELLKSKQKLISFPKEIDDLVADFALRSFNLKIDKLNEQQRRYASSFIRRVAEL